MDSCHYEGHRPDALHGSQWEDGTKRKSIDGMLNIIGVDKRDLRDTNSHGKVAPETVWQRLIYWFQQGGLTKS